MEIESHHNWFTEICSECGSAFSLTVEKRLHSEQTPNQKIEIFKTETFGNLMVIDGYIMLSSRDNFLYHEMLAHPLLFTHPNPRNVLIIGGGDCGTLSEVLRHPTVAQVDQVEIDERVTRLSEQYFPELCRSNSDPRANLYFTDGIQWMRDRQAESLDAVIVDSTDPVGPAEGLFNESFYRDVHTALGTEGIMVQQSESPILHIDLLNSIRGAMSRAGFSDLQTLLFPQPVYPGGWWSCTVAKKSGRFKGFRELASAKRPFTTRYYTPATHHAALATPPYLQQAFNQNSS